MAESIKYEFENKYWHLGKEVMGIDEAGRGPLCGPLLVCGVSFPATYKNDEIDDSKKLTATKRKKLFLEIIKAARVYKIVIVPVGDIDKYNIYRATQRAMQKIADDFSGMVLTDCMPLENCAHESLVKGDCRSVSIAAASIMAKVIRDHIMQAYDLLYPDYGFARHKGYPTPEHLDNLKKYGILPIYRQSYKLVKDLQPRDLFNYQD